jgi:hypothetical protein
MNRGQDPFYSGPTSPSRERQLHEDPLPQAEQLNPEIFDQEITKENINTLFAGFGLQINRATALLIEVQKVAEKLSVPVDADAVQVRAAIRRRDPSSDGSSISFDLYKDMVEFTIKSGRGMSFEVLGEFSGELQTDANKINRFIKSGGKGLSSWEEFLLYADQWLILFLLNRLVDNFQTHEHKECTATKEPPGTEDPPLQARLALAIAALAFILGMQDDDIILASSLAGDALNVPPVDLLNRARKLERTDMDRVLIEAVGASDHILITRYVETYIGRHPEGYDSWIAYTDLKRLREDAKITYVHAREYSAEYRALLDYTYNSEHTIPTVGTFGQMAGVQVTMTGLHYQVLTSKLAGIDLGISSIAGVLTSQFAMDLLCCLARFFGRQNLKTLKKIRALLAVASGGMHGLLNQSLLDPWSIMDWVVSGVLQGAVTFVEGVFSKAVNDVASWIDLRRPEQWEALYECPLIADLIDMIIRAVARLRNIMFNMVNRYIGNVNWRYQGMFRRWGTIYENRRLRTIVAILDKVIEAIELCSQFPDGQPPTGGDPPFDPENDPTLAEVAPKKLYIPPEIVEKFFKNDTGFIPRTPDLRPIPPVNHTFTTQRESDGTVNFQEICKGLVPESLLKAVEEST